MKFNERAWSGQVIHWIKDCIAKSETVFEDATNDEGVKMESGITKFPDILLFTDRISGTVFNGWELKLPDTRVDDAEMLNNTYSSVIISSDTLLTQQIYYTKDNQLSFFLYKT